MTLTAEIGGVALALQLASSVSYLLWVPLAAVAVWLVVWRVKFSIMENVAGLVGLTLIGFAVALFLLGPDWGELGRQALQQAGLGAEKVSTYWYYAIALFGAAMTPYEVFFFSSGAVEEGWTAKDLAQSRANVLVGFPLGGVLSLAIAGCAAVVLLPQLIAVTSLSQVMLPVAVAGGKLLLAVIIIGVVAATFGAALETTLSAGYTIAQFFGWPWGKFRAPAQAARFHLLMIICLIVGVGVLDDRYRSGAGHRVVGGVLRGRAAVDLSTDPDRGQRSGVHGSLRQLAADERCCAGLSGDHPGRLAVRHSADDHHRGRPMKPT